MVAAIATMNMLTAKSMSVNSISCKLLNPTKQTPKSASPPSIQNIPKGLYVQTINIPAALTSSTAFAGAIVSTLSICPPALAAQQIAEIAEGDNRGLALLLPIIPAVAWVLFNILQPALNQINRMRSIKGVIFGLGLCGMAASEFVSTPDASASEIAMIAEAASDNRGQLLLFVITPAILWVLYNILQPALNQLNKMRSQESIT